MISFYSNVPGKIGKQSSTIVVGDAIGALVRYLRDHEVGEIQEIVMSRSDYPVVVVES